MRSRQPTYIINADTITKDQVAQYLANAGVLNALDDLDHAYRSNPPSDYQESRETNERMTRLRLLGIMFKQARGLGWNIPFSWDPLQGQHPRRGKPDQTPYDLTDPRQLNTGDILKLLQNQAIILQHAAPVTTCKDIKGREFEFKMHLLQLGKPDNIYWGIPGLYDVKFSKRTDKKVYEYYLYDATGRKRIIKRSPKALRPKEIGCGPDTSLSISHNWQKLDKKLDLKAFALHEGHSWPVPFLPKSWDPFDEETPDEDSAKGDLLSQHFYNGFVLFHAPRAIEIVATIERPSLKDIDESENATVEGKTVLPNGKMPPDKLPLNFKSKRNKYEWQKLALKRWWESKITFDDEDIGPHDELKDGWTGGLIEACTGAGKTRFCFDAIEKVLKQKKYKNTRISIVVPTQVLLDQWHEEAVTRFGTLEDIKKLELPAKETKELVTARKKNKVSIEGISRHGAGHDEPAGQLSIWVINTASVELPVADRQHPHLVDKYPYHFLIVDEVHRSVAPSRRQIYDFTGSTHPFWKSAKFLFPEFRLGVTATLPKDEKKFDLLWRSVGPLLCQYRYADAIKKGNIPDFKLRYLETGLTGGETSIYSELTDKIAAQIGKVKKEEALGEDSIPSNIPDRWVAQYKEEQGDPPEKQKLKFLGGARARIYWSASNRLACALDLIRTKVAEGKKVLVFHKSIDGATALYNALHKGLNYGHDNVPHISAGLYHSQNPIGVNEAFLEAFRRPLDGSEGPPVQVLVSVQSLLEGLNVPDADVAVAVSADKSQIKAIQSLGRVLRNKKGSKEKKEFYFITVRWGDKITDSMRWSLPENEQNQLTGDEYIKYNFESSLRDEENKFVIDPPETLLCGDLYNHQEGEIEELHKQCGLMSYDTLHDLANDKAIHFLSEIGRDGSYIPTLTRSRLRKALIAYNDEIEKEPGDGSNAEKIEISFPIPAWPEWLLADMPHLKEKEPEHIIEDEPEAPRSRKPRKPKSDRRKGSIKKLREKSGKTQKKVRRAKKKEPENPWGI
jgi:superfamily II DNA or RNA helicase